jgi:hypothetical protein
MAIHCRAAKNSLRGTTVVAASAYHRYYSPVYLGVFKLIPSRFFSTLRSGFWEYAANKGPVRIQYKCLDPIYIFPEMNLHSLVISKTEL